MLNIEKYAAVDIGSNAIRLLITTVLEQEGKDTIFKKTSLVRVPIRLGEDVFLEGSISEKNSNRMVDAMTAFRLLMSTHNIDGFRVCATSAMREASNGPEVVQRIEKESGLAIEIIDGEDEAAIIASTDLKDLIQDDRVFLYVDVGGGSTELTLFVHGRREASKSLKLGTLRLLNKEVDTQLWDEMKTWIQKHTKPYKKISLIGSGGNINSIFKRSGRKNGKSLSYKYLSTYYAYLQTLTYEERVTELNMNIDRADVVVPATKIYLSAMKWCRGSSMYVPKIGLSDGIIRKLYQDKLAENPDN